jgi:hypothetical protein
MRAVGAIPSLAGCSAERYHPDCLKPSFKSKCTSSWYGDVLLAVVLGISYPKEASARTILLKLNANDNDDNITSDDEIRVATIGDYISMHDKTLSMKPAPQKPSLSKTI